jgi:hypothetical protein
MKDSSKLKNKWIHIRITEKEHQAYLASFSKTVEKTLANYSRKMLLDEPVIGYTRNLSLEALVEQFTMLIKDLNGVSNNFNQAVHKLHMLDKLPQFQHWILNYEMDKRKLLKDIEEIRKFVNRTSAIWLQS